MLVSSTGLCFRHEGLLVFPTLLRATEVDRADQLPAACSWTTVLVGLRALAGLPAEPVPVRGAELAGEQVEQPLNGGDHQGVQGDQGDQGDQRSGPLLVPGGRRVPDCERRETFS